MASKQKVSKPKVLIIEDSYIVRFEVKQALEPYGLEVLELDNAETFFRLPYHFKDSCLLLLDISLPGLDGLSTLERMRTNPEWANLPVIMLTGRADRHTVKRALQAGANDYIRKPFTSEELVKRIERILGIPAIGKENPP